MAKIVFWSPEEGTTGSTHTAIAVSTLMGMTHKVSCLLMQANFNSKKIESSYTPYDELKNSGVFDNSSIGINALLRLVTSNKLTADSIQNYAKPVLKERLDILYGMSSNDSDGYKQLVNNLPYITRKADEIYDLVFVDMPKSLNQKYVVETLNDADIVVCVVNQDAVKLSDFFDTVQNNNELKDKMKILVVGDYEAASKYNLMNLKLKYKVKEPLFMIPHNYLFTDACNAGSVVDFIYRNINADPKDYNGNFVFQTLNIVNRIVEFAKIKDN